MKADLRMFVKNYCRNKNLKNPFRRAPFTAPCWFCVRMTGLTVPQDSERAADRPGHLSLRVLGYFA
jgi:hypothetical protein